MIVPLNHILLLSALLFTMGMFCVLARRNLINEGDTREFEATWNGQWRWGPTTRIRHSRSHSKDTDFEPAVDLDPQPTGDQDAESVGGQDPQPASDQSPPVRGRSETRKRTSSFETKHKLRPRELPLFGKLKSVVDLRLLLELQSEERTSATGEAEAAPLSETQSWKVELNGTYKFSENFRGEGIIRVESTATP